MDSSLPPEKRLGLKGKSFLVVDENPNSRQLLIEICRTLDVGHVIVARCPTDALSTLQDSKIDIVICDWTQPPLDAPKFVMCVRTSEDARLRQIPIIVLKPQAKLSDVVEARDAGTTEFLAPPLSIQSVLRALESILLKPRAFVDSESFHGPDRRRRSKEVGEERRCRPDANEPKAGA